MTDEAPKRAEEAWTIRRLLTWTSQHFEKRGIDAPRLTTEMLLAAVLHLDRVRLYVELDRPVEKVELAAFKALIERRLAGEPTQYLTGMREFYGRKFEVDARVLIPRPETELLVEAGLRTLGKDSTATLLDLCTGSGCVAISLAAERKQVRVLATELSPEACDVARRNAEQLGVGERVEVLEGDLTLPARERAPFSVILSNPPYIATDEIDTLSPEVRKEPRRALDGGADGLVLIRRVVAESLPLLEAGGLLAIEIGETQGQAVLGLFQAAGYVDAVVEKDLERRDRIALGYKPPRPESHEPRPG